MKKIAKIVCLQFLAIMFSGYIFSGEAVDRSPHTCRSKEIMVEASYHHLGDYSSTEWLIPEPEGSHWETTFRIKRKFLEKYKVVIVKFMARHIDNSDLIINDSRIELDDLEELEPEQLNQVFQVYRVPIPHTLLRKGNNIIGIECNQFSSGNFDDMEFGEMTILFQK